MNFVLDKVGAATQVSTLAPSKIKLSQDGSWVLISFYGDFQEGIIKRIKWLNGSWTQSSDEYSGGYELYSEGLGSNALEISKTGNAYAWGFIFKSPDGTSYTALDCKGTYNSRLFPFEKDTSPRLFVNTTRNKSASNTIIFSPTGIKFSADGSLAYILYSGNYKRIESLSSSASLDFNSTLGVLLNFEISGDGLKLFCHLSNGMIYVHPGGADFGQGGGSSLNVGIAVSSFCSNYDGTILAVRNSGVKVYKYESGNWSQLGGDLPDGEVSLDSSGLLVNVGSKFYGFENNQWQPKWDTFGNLSQDGTVAVTLSSSASLQRYELKSVNNVFFGQYKNVSVYAGATPATSVYYGSKKLWPDAV